MEGAANIMVGRTIVEIARAGAARRDGAHRWKAPQRHHRDPHYCKVVPIDIA
jgi:hypothetical protein